MFYLQINVFNIYAYKSFNAQLGNKGLRQNLAEEKRFVNFIYDLRWPRNKERSYDETRRNGHKRRK